MKGYMRDKNGKYTKVPFIHSNFSGLVLLISVMILGAIVEFIYRPVELLSPLGDVPVVHAVETSPQPTTEPQTIEEKVKATFGVDGDRAWKMITECENKAVNPKALHHNSNGTWDAGLMQINQVHGYSQEYLFDVDNNLKVAKKIYDRQGFTPWSCAWVINETPFYMKGTK